LEISTYHLTRKTHWRTLSKVEWYELFHSLRRKWDNNI